MPDGTFQESRLFCQNRLPVKYVPKAPAPDRWLTFLHELLDDADIPTLQEYLGYCLIPSTKGQKMMLIVGKGGEGTTKQWGLPGTIAGLTSVSLVYFIMSALVKWQGKKLLDKIFMALRTNHRRKASAFPNFKRKASAAIISSEYSSTIPPSRLRSRR